MNLQVQEGEGRCWQRMERYHACTGRSCVAVGTKSPRHTLAHSLNSLCGAPGKSILHMGTADQQQAPLFLPARTTLMDDIGRLLNKRLFIGTNPLKTFIATIRSLYLEMFTVSSPTITIFLNEPSIHRAATLGFGFMEPASRSHTFLRHPIIKDLPVRRMIPPRFPLICGTK